MKTTEIIALVLGILGGLLEFGAALGVGIISGLVAILAGAFGQVLVILILAILGILGIIGAAITINKPKTGAILMFIAGIGGFLAVFPFGIPGGILLLIGGILALIGRKSKEIKGD